MVESIDSDELQRGGTWRLSFTLKGKYGFGNTFRISFPIGFTSKAIGCEISD
jgi:hypothetical protein